MDDTTFTGRTAGMNTDLDRGVEIRRTGLPERDLGRTPHEHMHYYEVAPTNRVLRWGPIMGGLATTIVSSLLLGSLFLGLGFDSSYGVFGGITASDFGMGAAIALALAVAIGSYVSGYVSDIRSRAEGIMNGFMVGVMTILTPVLAALFIGQNAGLAAVNNLPDTTNASGAAQGVANNIANSVPAQTQQAIQNSLVVAADNAWTVFTVGLLVLGVASLFGYLGTKTRGRVVEVDHHHHHAV